MKKITLLFLFCLVSGVGFSQTFQWVKQIAGTTATPFTIEVKDIISRNGEIYVCGSFTGTIDFNPKSGLTEVENRTANGVDGFIARYDADGDLEWVVNTDTAGNEDYIAMQIGSNSSSGNLNEIVVIHKIGTNSFRLTSYNSHNGVYVTETPTVTSSGTVNPTSFVNTLTFYYVVGSYTGALTAGSTTLNSQGGSDAFCVAFRRNPSFVVNTARSYGGTGNDVFNNIEENQQTSYVLWLSGSFTGTFSGEYSSGTSFSNTSAGGKDAIVMQVVVGTNSIAELRPIAAADVLVLAGTGDDEVKNTSYSRHVSVTTTEYLYVGGSFSGTVDFNPLPATTNNQVSAGGTDAFVAQYNISGSTYAYGYSNIFGGAQNDSMIECNAIKNSSLTAVNAAFLYYSVQRSNFLGGNFINMGLFNRSGVAQSFGGNLTAQNASTAFRGSGLFAVANDDIYSCGTFNGVSYFDPGTTNSPLTPISTAANGFIHKMGFCTANVGAAPTITTSTANVCSNETFTLTATGSLNNSAKWVWYQGIFCGSSTIVGEGTQVVVTSVGGIQNYYARAEGGCATLGNGACSTAVSVTTNSAPVASVSVSGSTLNAIGSSGATAYQWINCATNTNISGATGSSYIPTTSGNFRVLVTGSTGCTDESSCFSVTLSTDDFSKLNIKLYPNPVKNSFTIEGETTIEKLVVYNLLGQQVKTFVNTNTYPIDDLTAGTYLVEVTTEKGTAHTKIVKE